MTGFVQATRDDITARMKELEPLVAEYQQLEAAAAALADLRGGSPSVASRSRGRRSGAPVRGARSSTVRRRGRPRGSGARATQAIELVRAQPGITIVELATAMGIKQNYLYRVLPALEKDAKVAKRGRGWFAR